MHLTFTNSVNVVAQTNYRKIQKSGKKWRFLPLHIVCEAQLFTMQKIEAACGYYFGFFCLTLSILHYVTKVACSMRNKKLRSFAFSWRETNMCLYWFNTVYRKPTRTDKCLDFRLLCSINKLLQRH